MHRLLCVLALVAGTLVPATSAFAAADDSIGVRLLDAPVSRKDDPRARVYIVDHLEPGATIKRRIEVSNTTSESASISVYPGAASINKGRFNVADAGVVSELTEWTSVDRTKVNLRAGDRQPVTVEIRVPEDASEGERYGVVWASLSSPAPDGSGVTVVNRVGIRIYLSVGPGGEPPSDFTVDSLTAERTASGQPVVKALVHNTGGRALDLSGSLLLSDGPGGVGAGPFPADIGTTLAPGDTGSVVVPLDKRLPNGPWHARMELKSGLLERAVEGTITFPAAGRAAKPVPVHDDSNYGILLIIIAGVFLLAVLLLLLWLLRHRRRRNQVAGNKEEQEVALPVGRNVI